MTSATEPNLSLSCGRAQRLLKTACGAADINVGDGRFLGQTGEFRASGRAELHLDSHFLHVGDYHKKEQNREDKVGKRGRVQPRNHVSAAIEHAHSGPPFSLAGRACGASALYCSAMRCGQASFTRSLRSGDNDV